MKCPRDGNELVREVFGGAIIDSCTACDGTWMDKGELAETVGMDSDLLGGEKVNPDDLKDRNPGQKLVCPRCEDVEMEACYFSPEKKTILDHCQKCGGLWLDTGEFRDIIRTAFSAME